MIALDSQTKELKIDAKVLHLIKAFLRRQVTEEDLALVRQLDGKWLRFDFIKMLAGSNGVWGANRLGDFADDGIADILDEAEKNGSTNDHTGGTS